MGGRGIIVGRTDCDAGRTRGTILSRSALKLLRQIVAQVRNLKPFSLGEYALFRCRSLA